FFFFLSSPRSLRVCFYMDGAMTALLQQLQHVLATWDAVSGVGEPGTVDLSHNRGGSNHKNLFLTSVDAAAVDNNGTNTNKDHHADDEGYGVVGKSSETYPPWLTEAEGNQGGKEVVERRDGGAAPAAVLNGTCLPDTSVDPSLSRQRITKVELARAALALFTSNSGIYRPILQKTLGFIFGLIDELLEEKMDLPCREGTPQNFLPLWMANENEEVATAHERMRKMEVRMAKLVDEAATQRDHLNAEIAAMRAREAKLEGLLKHQILLSHAKGMADEVFLGPGDKETDEVYVKRLIARAENEKAIDELQGELRLLQNERNELSNRIQQLMELNGKYARQCVELAARLSVLTDHNIAIAVDCKRHQNEVLVEKQRSERYQVEIRVIRNVLVTFFLNRYHSVQSWWESLREKRIKDVSQVLLNLIESSKRFSSTPQTSEEITTSHQTIDERRQGTELEEEDDSDVKKKEASSPYQGAAENGLCHMWIPSAGNNPETPEHLRSLSSVEYIRINPLVAERAVYVILSEWGSDAELRPLDSFTRDYVLGAMKSSDASSIFTVQKADQSSAADETNAHLPITYAIDALSRSCYCGSLTYAFGLVTRRRANANLFRMLELDAAILISICRYLDIKHSLRGKPRGLIPVVQFASLLVAMYPSYPLVRLQQLLDAARNDAGNQMESAELLNYNVLLPERLFLRSAFITVENAGALWDTHFKHLLYKFVCDDVEDSWQSVEDALCFYASRVTVASESQILCQALSELRKEDRKYWLPSIRVALSCWDDLRADTASVLLDGMPRVPVKAVASYLRGQLIIRRGTCPNSSRVNEEFLFGLQERWNKFAGSYEKLNFQYYAQLVEFLDEKRHLVWGPASMATDDVMRHIDPSDDLSVGALLARLQRTNGTNK
ncbi:hypothetical protein MOQ_002757, partial [Trypanosoma cruzi marinkellei]